MAGPPPLPPPSYFSPSPPQPQPPLSVYPPPSRHHPATPHFQSGLPANASPARRPPPPPLTNTDARKPQATAAAPTTSILAAAAIAAAETIEDGEIDEEGGAPFDAIDKSKSNGCHPVDRPAAPSPSQPPPLPPLPLPPAALPLLPPPAQNGTEAASDNPQPKKADLDQRKPVEPRKDQVATMPTMLPTPALDSLRGTAPAPAPALVKVDVKPPDQTESNTKTKTNMNTKPTSPPSAPTPAPTSIRGVAQTREEVAEMDDHDRLLTSGAQVSDPAQNALAILLAPLAYAASLRSPLSEGAAATILSSPSPSLDSLSQGRMSLSHLIHHESSSFTLPVISTPKPPSSPSLPSLPPVTVTTSQAPALTPSVEKNEKRRRPFDIAFLTDSDPVVPTRAPTISTQSKPSENPAIALPPAEVVAQKITEPVYLQRNVAPDMTSTSKSPALPKEYLKNGIATKPPEREPEKKKPSITIPYVLDSFKKKGYLDRVKRLVCIQLQEDGVLDSLKSHLRFKYSSMDLSIDALQDRRVEKDKLSEGLRESFTKYPGLLFLLFLLFLVVIMTGFQSPREQKWKEVQDHVSEKLLREGAPFFDQVVQLVVATVAEGMSLSL